MRYSHEGIFRNLYNKPIFFDCPTLWDLNGASPQYCGVPSRSKSRSPSKTATQRLCSTSAPSTSSDRKWVCPSGIPPRLCRRRRRRHFLPRPADGDRRPAGPGGGSTGGGGLRRGRPAKFLAAERNARSVKDRKRSDGRGAEGGRREGRVKAPGHRHRRRRRPEGGSGDCTFYFEAIAYLCLRGCVRAWRG